MSDQTVKIKIKTEEEEIEWRFEEPPIAPQREWLWALAILGFAVVVFSALLKNYLLIIIIALTAFIIYAAKNKEPEFHDFKLDREGFHVNGKIYPYESFESFWIFPARNASLTRHADASHAGWHSEAGGGDKEIALRSKKHLLPVLTAPFNEEDETAIKRILSEHLPESEEEESLLDLLRKKLF